MTGTAIGIDAGSLGLRVARSGPDCRPMEVGNLVPSADQPWISAEFRAGSVDFVAARQQRSPGAVHKLVTELTAVRERVATEVDGEVDRVVLTVPARMESRERTALRDAARTAGFTEVFLIDDAVAAVLAADGAGTGQTVLVYSLGYSGFEAALLRVARGQVRVLHRAVADWPSGATMDYWIMKTWLEGLGERDGADLNNWTAAQWTRFRAAAEDVKHRLAAGERVDCCWPPWSTDPAPEVPTPTPEEFHRLVVAAIAETQHSVRKVLTEAGLTAGDIDAVLLVGGGTALPAVSAMLTEELDRTAHRVGPNHLACGAALYGARLRSTDAAPVQNADFVDVPEQPLGSTNLTLPARATPPDPASQGDPVAEARRLWLDGKPGNARAVLTALIDRASQLLAEIDHASSAGAVDGETDALLAESTPEARERARRAIDRAARSLRKGRLADAVSESHRAWKLAPDLDGIFRAMIKVHLSAAQAADTPDRFAKTYEWLNCAHMHARFNQEVVDCLVDRILKQARHHYDHGQHTEALALVEKCLDLDPGHRGVRELSAEIATEPHG
jgi:hypothetical protein